MSFNYCNQKNYKDTLCWHCANSVPNRAKTRGCSWSRELVPVEGWDAITTEVYLQRKEGRPYATSYIVKSCPEFVSDGREE